MPGSRSDAARRPPARDTPCAVSAVRVLICDDAVLYATMLSAWLRDDPRVEVVGTASSAPEALELAGRLAPDVVVLDHLLRDSRSPELLPKLRAQAPGATVVLVSGLPPDQLAEAAAAVAADAWIPKASTPDDVREEILRAAGLSPPGA